ncbi:MAG: hypothetical protein ACE5HS_22470, partial [bacterium]
MKSNSCVVFVCLLLFLLAPFAVAQKKISPGSKFKNKKDHLVYLLLILPPKSEFKNTTEDTFRVLSQKDVFKYYLRFQIDAKIDSLEKSLKINQQKMQQL